MKKLLLLSCLVLSTSCGSETIITPKEYSAIIEETPDYCIKNKQSPELLTEEQALICHLDENKEIDEAFGDDEYTDADFN